LNVATRATLLHRLRQPAAALHARQLLFHGIAALAYAALADELVADGAAPAEVGGIAERLDEGHLGAVLTRKGVVFDWPGECRIDDDRIAARVSHSRCAVSTCTVEV